VTMTPQEIQASLEAIIYAADEPASLDQIAKALGMEKPATREAIEALMAAYQTDDRGIEVRKVAGGWKFYTKAQHHDVVRKFIKSLQPPLRLTMPALETLAVIAYKQPCTVPEINEIRGVHVGGVIKTLLEKKLITTAGRKDVIGRPILYKTSKQFMMRFGLSDLDELPSLKEFEALAQAALATDEGIAESSSTDGLAQEVAAADANTPAAELVVTDEEAEIELELEQASANETSAEKDAISDASGELEAEAEATAHYDQFAPESDADADAGATETIHPQNADTGADSDKSRAASAGTSGTSDHWGAAPNFIKKSES
jgi:segregation and condensation protein B